MAGPKSHKGRREKGARGEREFFGVLNKYLPERLRIQREIGQSRDGGLDGNSASVGIEVKRQERLNLPKWLKQARDGAGGKIPVVAYRQNGGQWNCLVDLNPMQLASFMRWRTHMADTEAKIMQASEILPE